MKKLLSLLVMAIMALSVMPLVLADGADVGGDVGVDIEGSAPIIYEDHTQRSWYPNDQTVYTAEIYGTPSTNLYGDSFYDVSIRGSYAFTGETLTRYIVVEDGDGEDNIDTVVVTLNDLGVGSCSEIPMASLPWADGATLPQYTTASGALVYDDATMNTYRCILIVQAGWTGMSEIGMTATDDEGTSVSYGADGLIMNPALQLTLSGGVSFGTGIKAGDTVTSNTVRLNNIGSQGVVMDMYIASDDYFTDPTNPLAVCGTGNGIPYDAFSYYATKGSVDSGDNDASYPGLGTTCIANSDEFTDLTSYSGEVEDMCRIINHRRDASFLSQGQSMSLTFQLDVPTPCSGSFSNGQFHFVGRAV